VVVGVGLEVVEAESTREALEEGGRVDGSAWRGRPLSWGEGFDKVEDLLFERFGREEGLGGGRSGDALKGGMTR
jgi:hypothetical protein